MKSLVIIILNVLVIYDLRADLLASWRYESRGEDSVWYNPAVQFSTESMTEDVFFDNQLGNDPNAFQSIVWTPNDVGAVGVATVSHIAEYSDPVINELFSMLTDGKAGILSTFSTTSNSGHPSGEDKYLIGGGAITNIFSDIVTPLYSASTNGIDLAGYDIQSFTFTLDSYGPETPSSSVYTATGTYRIYGTAIPEPSTIAFIGLSTMGLYGYRRREKILSNFGAIDILNYKPESKRSLRWRYKSR